MSNEQRKKHLPPKTLSEQMENTEMDLGEMYEGLMDDHRTSEHDFNHDHPIFIAIGDQMDRLETVIENWRDTIDMVKAEEKKIFYEKLKKDHKIPESEDIIAYNPKTGEVFAINTKEQTSWMYQIDKFGMIHCREIEPLKDRKVLVYECVVKLQFCFPPQEPGSIVGIEDKATMTDIMGDSVELMAEAFNKDSGENPHVFVKAVEVINWKEEVTS